MTGGKRPLPATAGDTSQSGGQAGKAHRRWSRLPRAVVLSCLACVLAMNMAWAQDWQPELRPPLNETYRQPGDPIEIFIPPEVPIAVLQSLALELDNFDVTRLIRREGNLAVLDPPEPLSPGAHQLRLVQYGADGSIIERGLWTLDVRATQALQELSAGAELAGTLSYRVADDNLVDPPNRLTGQSAGEGVVEVAEGDWRGTAAANYFYNSQQDQSLDGRRLDLGEYLVTSAYNTEAVASQLSFGHHDIGAQNLIMSDFYRRGLSLSLGSADERATVTGFAQNAESVVGTPHFTGVGQPDERVQGFHGTVRPIPALANNVAITGTYYDGEGDTIGFSDGGDTETNGGDGWSVAADTLWFEERLRLRGEFARTSFDFDGEGNGFGAEEDHGYSFLASYAPVNGEEVGGEFMTWSFGGQYERIGTFFSSLANPFLVADRQTATVFTDLSWGEFAVQAQGGRQTNNVEDFDELPTDRTYNLFLNGTYTPAVEPAEDGGLTWIGQPVFGLSFNLVDIKQIDTPGGFFGDDNDNQTRTVTASAGSSYETWSWNLSETVSVFDDQTGLTGDSISYLTDLSAQVQVDDWLSLRPYAQWNLFDQDEEDETHNVSLGLDTTVQLIPETLSSTVNYNLNLASQSGDTTRTHFVGGEVLWNFWPAETNRPGLGLSVSGSYEDRDSDLDGGSSEDVYQVFLNLKVTLSAAY